MNTHGSGMGIGWCGGGVWPLDGGSAGVGVWMGFGGGMASCA